VVGYIGMFWIEIEFGGGAVLFISYPCILYELSARIQIFSVEDSGCVHPEECLTGLVWHNREGLNSEVELARDKISYI
jgi:hypothetical protein